MACIQLNRNIDDTGTEIEFVFGLIPLTRSFIVFLFAIKVAILEGAEKVIFFLVKIMFID